MPSLDSLDPKFYDFALKRPQKPLTCKTNPLNQNDKYFLDSKGPLPNQVPLKNLLKVQIQPKQDNEGKQSPQNNPDSKKDNPEDPILTNEKYLNPQSIQEKPQLPKELMSKNQITLPKGVMSQMKAIMVPKTDAEIREKLAISKPPSVNRPIEAIKQETIELKPPSIKNESAPSNKPKELIVKKQLEIPSKPKPPNMILGVENNLFGNRPTVQNDSKAQNLYQQKNFFASNVSEKPSKVSEKPSNLPQSSNNPFLHKVSQKSANNPPQPLNNFGSNLSEKPAYQPAQSTNPFVQNFSEKPAYQPAQSTNQFVQKVSEKPAYHPPQSTNLFVQKAPQKPLPSKYNPSSNNIFAQHAPEKPSNQTFPRPAIFGQENQTKPKVQPNLSSVSNVFSSNNGTLNNLVPKPRDPAQVVNKQQSINAIGNNVSVNSLGRSNAAGFNWVPNQLFQVQPSNNRNLSVGHQIGNAPFLNNNPAQVNRAFSVSTIPKNQNTAPKRPKPCLFPIRIQRQWEEAHGKKWYQLQSHEIPAAEESMKKRLHRQNGNNQAPKPNIFDASVAQNQQRKSFQNPNHTNGKPKPIFKF